MERVKNFLNEVDMDVGGSILGLTVFGGMICFGLYSAIVAIGVLQVLGIAAMTVGFLLFAILVTFIFGKIGFYISKYSEKKRDARRAEEDRKWDEAYQKRADEREAARQKAIADRDMITESYNQSQIGDKSDDI